MTRFGGRSLGLLGSALVLALMPACGASESVRLDPDNLALLRLDYLERAAQLPAVNIESIELPEDHRVGRFSAVVWRIRSEALPGRELYRPLPVDDVDLQLYQTLVRTFEGFGFNMRGWSEHPDLRMRVEVDRLVLTSEESPADLRACDLSLTFHLNEYPSGIPIERFTSRASLELPGSWTSFREDEVRWMPDDPAEDPIALAATAAVQKFLQQSLDFWKSPAHWEEGGVKLSTAKSP